eukprot:868512-Pelagomonas_calceolata.AAC.1
MLCATQWTSPIITTLHPHTSCTYAADISLSLPHRMLLISSSLPAPHNVLAAQWAPLHESLINTAPSSPFHYHSHIFTASLPLSRHVITTASSCARHHCLASHNLHAAQWASQCKSLINTASSSLPHHVLVITASLASHNLHVAQWASQYESLINIASSSLPHYVLIMCSSFDNTYRAPRSGHGAEGGGPRRAGPARQAGANGGPSHAGALQPRRLRPSATAAAAAAAEARRRNTTCSEAGAVG